MTDKQFNAVLDKNQMARMIKRDNKTGEISLFVAERLISLLENIEEYIGLANQPSVRDIFESDLDI